MTPQGSDEKREEFLKRSSERQDSLLDRLNQKIQATLDEFRKQGKENEPGIESEFEGGLDWRDFEEEDE